MVANVKKMESTRRKVGVKVANERVEATSEAEAKIVKRGAEEEVAVATGKEKGNIVPLVEVDGRQVVLVGLEVKIVSKEDLEAAIDTAVDHRRESAPGITDHLHQSRKSYRSRKGISVLFSVCN